MEDHSRTIIHIDINCFYAQVEMLRDPSLKNKPLGIQQKNIVVTSNYTAREYGVKKCMLITEAKKLCPNLVLVNGEDLYNYRQVCFKMTSVLQKFSEIVERLGLDEHFIDVSNLVNKKLKSSINTTTIGCTFGETEMLCDCGCTERIGMGSYIAQEMRKQIYQELNLTTCAGIAHNKLLAKIVGSKNKPNKQTLVFPNNASELILSLELVKHIPWIGNVSAEQLSNINITKVNELQNCSIGRLKNIFGSEKAESMWNASFGIDKSPVKKTGKPQSIGVEDSCNALMTETDVLDKLKCLLRRLMVLVKEDERIPKTIKLTVRKLNYMNTESAVRETKQCNINTPLDNEEKTMNIIMTLFRKAVNTKEKFHITLLGLSFTKFEKKISIKNTFFLKREKEIQSVLDLKNQEKNTLPVTESCGSSFHTENNKVSEDTSIYGNSVTNNKKLEHSDTQSGSIRCPPHLNAEVFRELPTDMQEELFNDYKRKKGLDDTLRPHKKSKPNSILNYVVRQQK